MSTFTEKINLKGIENMKTFIVPEIEIVPFEVEDVITTSGVTPPDAGDDGLGWG